MSASFPFRSWPARVVQWAARGVLGMPEQPTDTVIIKFDVEDPIGLDELIAGFSAISSQYRKTLDDHGHRGEKSNARLYVSRISDGCIEVEVAVYALVFKEVVQAMDYSLIMTDFTVRVGRLVDYFSGKGRGADRPSKSDTKDAKNFLDAVANRNSPHINIKKAKYVKVDGEYKQEIEIEWDIDSDKIHAASAAAERELLEQGQDTSDDTKKNVLFVWHQANRDPGKSQGRTGDKAIVPTVSQRPLPVFFPAGTDAVKRAMTHTEENPLFRRGYMVDVNVQYLDGKPRVYTVLEMHTPVDLDDPEDPEQPSLPIS